MNSPSQSRPSRYLSTLVIAGVLSLSAQTYAQTIYSDSFTTGTNGTVLTGGTPDVVDATGATYLTTARGGGPGFPTYSGSSANTSFSDAAALSLATGGSFTRGTTFTISADISIGNIGGFATGSAAAGGSTRGVYLGFFSSGFAPGAVNTDSTTGFTGFAFQNNGSGSGILQFISNGDSTTAPSLQVLTGALSTSTFYNLRLSVNTTTGSLTSIIFNGTDVTSSFAAGAAGTFTDAATAFAGFGASSNAAATSGQIDNFTVSGVVPEPGTWAMALVGVGLLVGVQRFRARNA